MSAANTNLLRHGLPVTTAKDHKEDRLHLQADAVIVGSGAGGSVAAYELATAGKKVIVLEAGPYVPSSRFTEEMAKSVDDLYQDKGAQTNKNGDITLLQGRCVGGSTVINGSAAFRTPDAVLEHWVRDYGLKHLTPQNLSPYFDKIEKNLSVHINQDHEVSQNSLIIERGVKKLGYSWKRMSRNVKQCALTGFCVAGCASDRKQSMLVTYLPWAVHKGASIFADTHVTEVLEEDGRATGVSAEVVDPETKKLAAKIRVDAQVVILAAGAVQTPLLLQKSRLANSSNMVGENLACHPSMFFGGLFDEPVYGWKGAMNSCYLDDFRSHEQGAFIFIENMVGPVELASIVGTGTGASHMEMMKNIKHIAGMLSFMHDENHGRVYWQNGAKIIDYALHPKNLDTVRKSMKVGAKILFAAGAKKVYLPTTVKTELTNASQVDSVVEDLSLAPNTILFTSYHPQGTCRMGLDSHKSVVNEFGETHDVKGLFITDASIFPGTTLVNPQMTVYMLSNFITDRILKTWHRYSVGSQV